MSQHLQDITHSTAENQGAVPATSPRKTWLHSRFVFPLHVAWSTRTPRERKFLMWGGLTVLLITLWFTGLAPALSSIESDRQRIVQLQSDLTRVQAMGLRAQWLRSQTMAPDTAAPLTTNLQQSLLQADLPVTIEQVSQNNRSDPLESWTLRIEQTKVDDLMQWLSRSLPAYNLQVAVVSLRRAEQQDRDRPGYVTGVIELAHPGPAAGGQP